MFIQHDNPFTKKGEPRKTTKGKGRNFRTTKEGAGMTAAGVRKYRKKIQRRITK